MIYWKLVSIMVLIFVAFFGAGTLVAGTDLNADSQVQEDLNTLSMTAGVHQTETWGILNFVTTPFEYFSALMRVWNYQSDVFPDDSGLTLIKLFTTTPIVIAAVAMIAFGFIWLFKS